MHVYSKRSEQDNLAIAIARRTEFGEIQRPSDFERGIQCEKLVNIMYTVETKSGLNHAFFNRSVSSSPKPDECVSIVFDFSSMA